MLSADFFKSKTEHIFGKRLTRFGEYGNLFS